MSDIPKNLHLTAVLETHVLDNYVGVYLCLCLTVFRRGFACKNYVHSYSIHGSTMSLLIQKRAFPLSYQRTKQQIVSRQHYKACPV